MSEGKEPVKQDEPVAETQGGGTKPDKKDPK